MSFRKLRLSEFEEEWDNSDWKLYFEETTFITILWKEPKPGTKNGERVLAGIKNISFDGDDLDNFKITYNKSFA